jgi:hypothetical protein
MTETPYLAEIGRIAQNQTAPPWGRTGQLNSPWQLSQKVRRELPHRLIDALFCLALAIMGGSRTAWSSACHPRWVRETHPK